jgi:hypothetical protein
MKESIGVVKELEQAKVEIERLNRILKLKRPRTWERIMFILKSILNEDEYGKDCEEIAYPKVIDQIKIAYKLMESDIDE